MVVKDSAGGWLVSMVAEGLTSAWLNSCCPLVHTSVLASSTAILCLTRLSVARDPLAPPSPSDGVPASVATRTEPPNSAFGTALNTIPLLPRSSVEVVAVAVKLRWRRSGEESPLQRCCLDLGREHGRSGEESPLWRCCLDLDRERGLAMTWGMFFLHGGLSSALTTL